MSPSGTQDGAAAIRSFLERSAASAQHAAAEREAQLRALVPVVADVLRAMGADRVWLFGSLVWGGLQPDSDLDVAVSGLPPGRFISLALRLADRLDDDVAQMAFAASLHHYYSALESVAERVLRAFGQTIPKGERWLQEVIEVAALDVPELRPALFSAETVPLLRQSLAFRHFFRHAYAATWDRAELEHNAQTLRALLRHVDLDLDRFVASIRAALDETAHLPIDDAARPK